MSVTQLLTTADSSPWTVPFGVYSVTAEIWPGGGAGAAGGGGDSGGGGGGGAYSKITLAVTPGGTVNFQVGAAATDSWWSAAGTAIAKAGANASTTTGGAGGDSGASIGDEVQSGGPGGAGGTATDGGGGGGAAGTGNTGGTGADGSAGGAGGTGFCSQGDEGDGGGGGTAGGTGSAGLTYGGGGGGGHSTGTPAGGAGAEGAILLTFEPLNAAAIGFVGRVHNHTFLEWLKRVPRFGGRYGDGMGWALANYILGQNTNFPESLEVVPVRLPERPARRQSLLTLDYVIVGAPEQTAPTQSIPPQPVRLPERPARHQAVVTFEHLIGPENQVTAPTQIIPPKYLPIAVRPVKMRQFSAMLPQYDEGNLDIYAGVWNTGHQQPVTRLHNLAPRAGIHEPLWVQAFYDQTIDFTAIYTPPTQRFPLVRAKPPASYTDASDPFPFESLDVDAWGPTLTGWRDRPKQLAKRSVPHDVSPFDRGNDLPDELLGWSAQPTARGRTGMAIFATGIPVSEQAAQGTQGTDGPANPVAPSGQSDGEQWFAQQQPPRRLRPQHIGRHAFVAISSTWTVPGPFYVVAGQVSPAAGVVAGDVRAAGED